MFIYKYTVIMNREQRNCIRSWLIYKFEQRPVNHSNYNVDYKLVHLIGKTEQQPGAYPNHWTVKPLKYVNLQLLLVHLTLVPLNYLASQDPLWLSMTETDKLPIKDVGLYCDFNVAC